VDAILSLMFLTGQVADFYLAGGVICGGACLLLADFLLSGFSIVSGYPIHYITPYPDSLSPQALALQNGNSSTTTSRITTKVRVMH